MSSDAVVTGVPLKDLIQSSDWSLSPLGPPGGWSPELRTTVDLMLNAQAQIVLFWGPDYVALYNDAYAPTIGNKHPRALGRPARENWSELWTDLEPLLRGVRETGETFVAKDRQFYIERHGYPEDVYFDISYSAVTDEKGAVAGVLCIVSETTERVLAIRRMRESETRFRNMADNSPVMLWVTDPNGLCTYLNSEWYRFTGQTVETALGLGWLDVAHPDDRAKAETAFLSANSTREPFRLEYRLKRADGVYRWAIDTAVPRFDADGQFLGYIGSVIDIDERHESEERLRQSEARFQAIANSIDQMVWSTRADGHHDYYNDRWYEFTGVPYGSTDGQGWNGMFHPDDREHAWEKWRQSLKTGEPYRIEYRLRHRSGQYRWVLGRAQPVRDETGGITRWFGTCTDIHETKIAEDRRIFLLTLGDIIRESHDPVAVAVAASKLIGEALRVTRAGYGEVDASGAVIHVVRDWTCEGAASLAGESRMLESFGPAITEVLQSGRTLVVTDAYTDPRAGPDYAEAWEGIDCRALIVVPLMKDGTLRSLLYLHESAGRNWTNDDVELAEDVAQRTWEAIERARVEVELRDLNATLEQRVRQRTRELEETETALRQSQKMEAVGQLTGGIAHDFNNMLAVVIGGLNLLQRRLARGETNLERYIDAAMEGANRAASLTQRLLAFSRQQPLAPEPIDANRMVAGMTELLTRTLGEDILVETVLSAGLWKLNADANQLENVVLNLALNARDAMPGGGRLTIETANAYVDDTYGGQHHIPPGQYVLLAISDTGTGMSPEVMARAFDPFFTTKTVGKGTGLGLSQVFGFVRQSGGHVKLYSEVGHGTTVKAYFPRYYGEAEPALSKAAARPASGGHASEIVLVVEDEDRVRSYSVEALRELGYTVVHAPNGPEALRIIEAGQEVTVLFTDVVMPEMTGKQLSDRALAILPNLKVLYTTGYTRNAVVHNGVLDPGTNFLPKPFSIEQLAGKLRDVLDG